MIEMVFCFIDSRRFTWLKRVFDESGENDSLFYEQGVYGFI